MSQKRFPGFTSPEALFRALADQSVLIVGDVMVDAYWWGKVNRISPEAPVPVVAITHKEHRLGGAANVARNLQAIGAKAMVAAVVGDDDGGRICRGLFKKAGLDDALLVDVPNRPTTIKSRIIGNHHQMLRVDEETVTPLDTDAEEKVWLAIRNCMASGEVKAVLLEDYDKGLLTPGLIDRIIAFGKEKGIPVTVDPKRNQFQVYKEATLFKPNLREMAEGTGKDLSGHDLKGLQETMEAFRKEKGHEVLMVTLAEQGVVVLSEDGFRHIPAVKRDIADVSGAGDTVIGLATLGISAGLAPEDAAFLANLGGGLVCESVGVVTVPMERLKAEVEKFW
ncbi:MAG: D-glycero-beta-D-manno-heptose-7-phosphate kinase [Flavobacteriales bacterium]|nr:D-glycero-beta-D-manno-heptose-7-phosphate kinase [Flavobacteriales bacterium]MCB9447400.1 D-glycero-beta-D-manno-heptose-7-phosphate kinase [Flavobacteriales bacterium]